MEELILTLWKNPGKVAEHNGVQIALRTGYLRKRDGQVVSSGPQPTTHYRLGLWRGAADGGIVSDSFVFAVAEACRKAVQAPPPLIIRRLDGVILLDWPIGRLANG